MATTDIERLAVLIEANTKQYTAAMNKLQADTNRALGNSAKAVRGLDTQLKSMSSSAAAFGKSFSSAFGIAGGVTLLTQLPQLLGNVVDEASKIVDAADRIGMTTDQLQELAHVAALADVEFSTVVKSMEFFARATSEAGQETGKLHDLFEKNKVSITDANGNLKTQQELLEIVADLMNDAANAQDKLNISRIAFGRGGAGFVNALNGGAEAIRKGAEEARRAGTILDEKLIRKLEKLGDKWLVRWNAMLTVVKEFVAKVTIELDKLVDMPSLTIGGVEIIGSVAELTTKVGALNAQAKQAESTFAGLSSQLDSLKSKRATLTDPLQIAQNEKFILDLEKHVAGLQAEIARIRGQIGTLTAETPPIAAPPIIDDDGETDFGGGGGSSAPIPRMKPIIDETTVAVSALNTAMQSLADSAADFATTFIADLRAGKSAAEALGGVLTQLADQMIQSGIQVLANSIFGGFGAGGLVGGLFGRAGGGHVGARQAYMVGERGPELFVPNTSGTIARGAIPQAPTKIVLEFVEGDAFGGRVREISAPQSQQIAVSVVGANERRRSRMEKTAA